MAARNARRKRLRTRRRDVTGPGRSGARPRPVRVVPSPREASGSDVVAGLRRAVTMVERDPHAAREQAERLLRAYRGVVVAASLADLVEHGVADLVDDGWALAELREVALRLVGAPASAMVPTGASTTRLAPRGTTVDEVALSLRLLAALGTVRRLPAVAGTHPSAPYADAGDVLADLEVAGDDPAADRLAATAQRLASHHLLAPLSGTVVGRLVTRRVWLDPPYLSAKAEVVHAVARANRCRAVGVPGLGLVVVVGTDSDAVWVEMASVSLLVQAHHAVLRHGSRVDVRGRSRTRSFRQAFLVAYAQRLGRLLVDADRAVTVTLAPELQQMLRRRRAEVDLATMRWFPHVSGTRASVTNEGGWLAGEAAADAVLAGGDDAWS